MKYILTILLFILAANVSGQSSFGSQSFSKPTLKAITFQSIYSTSLHVEFGVSSNGGAAINKWVLYMDTAPQPVDTVFWSPLNNIIYGQSPLNLWDYLIGLTPSTTYYLKFCANNVSGETCSSVYSVTLPASLATPSVSVSAATSITTTTATLNGNVTGDGGSTVTSRGFLLTSLSSGITTDISSGSGTGTYYSDVTGLNPSSSYTYKAYAINSIGTSYGDLSSFQTLNPSSVPILTTTTASTITTTTALTGGNITSNGGFDVLTRGVCYSTSPTPTIANNTIASGTGNGIYSILLNPLISNTLYYYRAYAINSIGTGYGNVYSFTTAQSVDAPTVTTTSVTSITAQTATSGGNVTNTGGSTITARGIVWGISANPTVDNRIGQTSQSGTTGSYSSSITGLECGNTYHVRAYATNSYGTSYGTDITFSALTTLSIPTVTTSTVSGITSSGGYFSGVVNNTGCLILQEYGFEISTNSGMTGSDSYSCKGVFSRWITLSASTTYYYRAYAINSQGTGYGTIYSFTTLSTTSLSYISSRRDYFTENQISINYTIPTGATLLIVSVHTRDGVKRTGSAPTYNGVAMIFAATDAYNEIYYLENPSVGYYTLAMGNTSNSNVGVTSTWFNHGSTSFTVYDTGNSTGTSINVTSAISTVSGKNAFIYNSDTFRNEGTSTPLNYTEYSHTHLGMGFIGAAFGIAAQYGWIAGTGSDVNMTYTLTGAKEWHSLSVCFTFN